jgi:hypothetical protein
VSWAPQPLEHASARYAVERTVVSILASRGRRNEHLGEWT